MTSNMKKTVYLSQLSHSENLEKVSKANMSSKQQNTTRKISTLNEKPLHESLKQWYTKPGDMLETSVDGFIVDIVRGDLLIEIQTKNFSAIRRKLDKLTIHHPVRLVFPVPCEKWIIRLAGNGNDTISRRRSPRRGAFVDVFEELIYLPELLLNPNFSIEILLIHEEEVRQYDRIRGWRRRGWVTHERKLLKVIEQKILETPADLRSFVPSTLIQPFTVAELSASLAIPRRLAQKMAYCLRLMGCITPAGKRTHAILYSLK